jgi:transposase
VTGAGKEREKSSNDAGFKEMRGKIMTMNSLAQRPVLDLKPAAQTALELALQAQLAALQDQAQRDAERLQAKDAEIHAKDLKIQALTLELAHLRRIRYSAKSETLAPLQRQLFEDSWNEDVSAVEAEVEQMADAGPTVAKPKRPRAGRQPLPAHLPRIEHVHEPESCQCGQCGQDLVKIGEDITEQLDVEPARFFVHRHLRPQYARSTPARPARPSVRRRSRRPSSTAAWRRWAC